MKYNDSSTELFAMKMGEAVIKRIITSLTPDDFAFSLTVHGVAWDIYNYRFTNGHRTGNGQIAIALREDGTVIVGAFTTPGTSRFDGIEQQLNRWTR